MRSPVREISTEEMAKQQTDDLNRIVALDSTQYQLVYIMNYADISAFRDSMKVRKERFEKNREIGKRIERTPRSKEDFEVRRKIAEQRRLKRNEAMKEILTPEQYTKYIEYEENRQKNMRPGLRHGRR